MKVFRLRELEWLIKLYYADGEGSSTDFQRFIHKECATAKHFIDRLVIEGILEGSTTSLGRMYTVNKRKLGHSYFQTPVLTEFFEIATNKINPFLLMVYVIRGRWLFKFKWGVFRNIPPLHNARLDLNRLSPDPPTDMAKTVSEVKH